MRRAKGPLPVVMALGLLCLCAGTAGAAVTLSVPKLQAHHGQEIEVPITVKGGKGMSALQVRLTYDSAMLEVVQDSNDPDKAVARGKILPDKAIAKVYTETPGRLPILFLGGADPKAKTIFAVEEDGTLLTIRFRVIGPAGQKSALALEKAQAFAANDMDMIVMTEPGEIAIGSAVPWLWIAIGAGALVLLLVVIMAARRGGQQ